MKISTRKDTETITSQLKLAINSYFRCLAEIDMLCNESKTEVCGIWGETVQQGGMR